LESISPSKECVRLFCDIVSDVISVKTKEVKTEKMKIKKAMEDLENKLGLTEDKFPSNILKQEDYNRAPKNLKTALSEERTKLYSLNEEDINIDSCTDHCKDFLKETISGVGIRRCWS
jgi:hypothetical protein